ncbi:efflux transporter outer membrane subunit [Hydrogenophaga palleronii]|uniref:efflux transporter outer membrane subunit n=1 Tax=Hydrogenophaga palleronii TaxID=65655 RepID=UPI0008265579|nr:efflux transporter outer membrane subunit [Hydrogenophaga palleronii]
MKRLSILLPLALLSACSLTPHLERPALPVPAAFPALHGHVSPGTTTAHAAQTGWRSMFGDAALQQLIELALEHNRDLRLAALNVQSVQTQYRIQQAHRLPAVVAEASASRERTAVGSGTVGTPTAVSQQVGMGVGISAFEFDLFGRVRALSDAALARYLASEQGRAAAQIALVGAVADAFFAQQLAREQLQLAEQTLADWRQSLALVQLLKQADQSSGLDVAQAEGQVASAESELEARQRTLAQAGNALQLLVGRELPADLPAATPLERQSVAAQLSSGLPSDLLLARPDLQQAEQMLVAANADIGAARAAFFPSISLTASYGFASPSLGGLFDASRQVWRFAPQIAQPLFQGGRLRSELRLAELRRSEAIAQYERAIQIAFREVADALAARATLGRQVAAQLRAVDSAQRRLGLSELRYRAGLDGRLEWLDAQRQAYAARQALLELRRAEIGNAVALYKALGGGMRAHDGGADPALASTRTIDPP